MPTYKVRDPKTGRTLRVTADSPPTPAELEQLFGEAETAAPDRLESLLAWLPAVGGAAGGILGAGAGLGIGSVPAALGGAALGGGGGKALEQLARRALSYPTPGTMTGAASEIAGEMPRQAAAEAGGQLVAGAGRMVGRGLMDQALRPTYALLKEFPDVIERALEARVPVGRFLATKKPTGLTVAGRAVPGTVKGSVMAARQLGQAGKAVRQLLRQAEAGGKEFSPEAVLRPVQEVVEEIQKQAIGDAEQRQVEGLISEFLRRHPGPLSPTAVKDLKQMAGKLARPVMKAEREGYPVQPEQGIRARFERAIERGSRGELETIPGMREAERKTQGLIGVTRATKQAEARRLGAVAETVSGASGIVASLLTPESSLPSDVKRGVLTWLTVRGILSPRTLSRSALLLTKRQTQELLRQFPRLAEEYRKRTTEGVLG